MDDRGRRDGGDPGAAHLGMREGQLAACGALTYGQTETAPVNDRPNPYRTLEDWARLPDGRRWGSMSAVEVDRDGKSIWVAERCGANSCATSPLAPILKLGSTGVVDKSFGAGRSRRLTESTLTTTAMFG